MTLEAAHMRNALTAAARAIGFTEPNPRVGCVLVDDLGLEIGSGHTQQAGGPHAEATAAPDQLPTVTRVSAVTLVDDVCRPRMEA